MTEDDFKKRIAELGLLTYGEDFETALCDLYACADGTQRAFLRAAIKAGEFKPLKTWRHPTDFSLPDLTREQFFRQKLMRMSMYGRSGDFRDQLCSLGFLYHSLRLLGVDADGVLNEVARLSDPSFAELLTGFLDRSPEQRSLEVWGLEVVQSEKGPIVARRPYKRR